MSANSPSARHVVFWWGLIVGLVVVIPAVSSRVRVNRQDNSDFPAGDVPRSSSLVSPEWLHKVLDHAARPGDVPSPSTFQPGPVVVLEVSWAPLDQAKDYLSGHIPGAIHCNTDLFENGSPQWHLRSINELQTVVGDLGISNDTTVIVYSEQLIAAARAWWILTYVGVRDVRLLDGGLRGWKRREYIIEQVVNQPHKREFNASPREWVLATTDQVRSIVGTSRCVLADARSPGEYAGEISGYTYLDARGRIPAAIAIGDADDSSQIYRQANGELRPPREILAHWEKLGLINLQGESNEDREIVFYCGGGWRSSLTFFYAWLLGFERIRNYSDGWGGWSTRYIADPSAKGGTPGWRQESTGNAVEGQPQ